MGSEQPDIDRMHRLFDDALDDVDLTGDVVPGVLTGYDRKVKLRRFQGAGAALAVLATAGVAVSALPHGGHADSTRVSAASTTPKQGPDYCSHQHWLNLRQQGEFGSDELLKDPTAEEANCEALQTALQKVFPTAYVVPKFTSDLALDPRVDQALLKKVKKDQYSDMVKWSADTAKYFGSELKYLALHPEDPANVYTPDDFELVTSTGRESIGVGMPVPDKNVPKNSVAFMDTTDALDCAKLPSALKGKLQCTPVGVPSGWHGALWDAPPGGVDAAQQTADLTDGHGKNIMLVAEGDDYQAWYHQGMYVLNMGTELPGDTWINRWTGQTYEGSAPPALHVWTDQQWAQFLGSPGFKKYADSYLGNVAKTAPSPTHSR